jgi:hypothetical protein
MLFVLLQNLREMRKFFADRNYQKGGNSRAKYASAQRPPNPRPQVNLNS